MKLLTTLSLSFFAFAAMAQSNLSDMKRTANESIGREMSTLETNKNCINGAKTVEAFKACKYDLNENMKAQKQEDAIKKDQMNKIEDDSIQKKDEVMDQKKDLETGY